MTAFSMSAEAIHTAMRRVFNYMFLAVIWTAFVSLGIASLPDVQALVVTGPLKWPVIIAPFVCIFFMGTGYSKYTTTRLLVVFTILATAFGAMLSTIFLVYAKTSIVLALISASSVFVVSAGYGYFSKRNLTGFGNYLFVALVALLVAMLANLIIGSTVLSYIISAVAVLLFTKITIYDAQRVRDELYYADNGDIGRIQVFGALSLYLDFMNLFVNILKLLGIRVK
jgi:FtsH-binding integral membrane protein